jgi:hypothetical protein
VGYADELLTAMNGNGLNDSDALLREIAGFLAHLRPATTYLSVPTRPPAEGWAQPPSEEIINRAYYILHERIDHAEYLIGYECNAFAFTGNVEQDLLSITAVHPMREEAVNGFMAKAGTEWSVIRSLIERRQLVKTEYKGRKFNMKRLDKPCREKSPPGRGLKGVSVPVFSTVQRD